MTAQPHMSSPDTGSYEVIHLGGQAAVVMPVTDFLRLRALEQAAAPHELEDAEDTAAMLEWKARDAAGQTTLVSADEAKAPAGHAPVSLRVDYDERAINQAAAFLDDPQGMHVVLDAIDRLADDPRPAGSSRTGRPTSGGCG